MPTRASEWEVPLSPLGIFPSGSCHVTRTGPAPEGLGLALARVPPEANAVVDVDLEGLKEGVLVRGQVRVPVGFECSRCLEPGSFELEVPIDEMFFFEAFPEDEDVRLVSHDTIDFEPVLCDNIGAQLPFRPLCRDDCSGLCSECGVSLRGRPDHRHEVLDPRWEGLRAFQPSSEDTKPSCGE